MTQAIDSEYESDELVINNDSDDSTQQQVKVLLNDFTYEFRQRDHIGIVGANGYVMYTTVA